MKKHLKRYTSLSNYIAFLRRQPEHIQYVYAAVFAGSITLMIAISILYIDYGFWHERYIRKDDLVATSTEIVKEQVVPESPLEAFSHFLGEAHDRFGSIDMPSKDIFSGKEVYGSSVKIDVAK